MFFFSNHYDFLQAGILRGIKHWICVLSIYLSEENWWHLAYPFLILLLCFMVDWNIMQPELA